MNTNWKPDNKITAAGGLGVPLAVIVAWVLTQSGVEVPVEVQAAMGAVISTLVGYLAPRRQKEMT